MNHPLKETEEIFDEISRLVSTIDAGNRRLTSVIADSRGLAPNDVLFAGTIVLDPVNFFWERDFEVPFAAVTVIPTADNVGGYSVANEPFPGESVPSTGAGRFQFGKTTAATVPLTGSRISVWSTAGGTFGVIVLARPVAPFVGVIV